MTLIVHLASAPRRESDATDNAGTFDGADDILVHRQVSPPAAYVVLPPV
jgi:hypothetical protein